jgi:hypothetical protein
LTRKERSLLVRVGLRVVAVRVGMWAAPKALVRRSIERETARRPETVLESDELERLSWAVAVVSRRIPGATCLVQALATDWLLRDIGEPADLRIGVVRSGDGAVQAHAWVECQGRVVAGKIARLSRYSVLQGTRR